MPSTIETFTERIARLHTMGLDPRYTDVLYIENATGADLAAMSIGCHYDYRAQRWVDGHDHAHMADDIRPLLFCGADRASCHGGAR